MTRFIALLLCCACTTSVISQETQKVDTVALERWLNGKLDSINNRIDRKIDSTERLKIATLTARRNGLQLTINGVLENVKRENDDVVRIPTRADGKPGYPKIITNRALNVFFADKIGSYLSSGGDLSLFSNYATLSTADGKFSINQNLGKAGANQRVTHLTTIGFRANLKDAFATLFDGKHLTNEMGFTFSHTFMGNGTMSYDAEDQRQNGADNAGPQKARMNEVRAILISQYEAELLIKIHQQEEANARINTDHIATGSKRGLVQRTDSTVLAGWKKEYDERFAKDQSKKIAELKQFNLIRTFWGNVGVYLPITRKKFLTAADFAGQFSDSYVYPFEFSASGNWIFEWARCGRLFINLNGSLRMNNAADADKLTKTSLDTYKRLGGGDTLALGLLEKRDAYVGSYETFWSPQLKFQTVYFFAKVPFGISGQLEQNFGKYSTLNARLGMPFTLNDKDGKPTVNFELQFRFSDLTDKVEPDKRTFEKTQIGFSVGVPFNSILK